MLIASSAKTGRLLHLWVSVPVVLGIVFASIFFFAVLYDTSGLLKFILTGSLTLGLILSVFIAIVQGVRQRYHFGRNTLIIYFVGCFLVQISSGIGMLGSNIIVDQCETFHLEVGNTIVKSLESYYSDRKEYPNSLSELIPQYLQENSVKTCFSIRLDWDNLSSHLDGFYYKKCSSGVTQLSIPEMGTGHFHIYDLDDKQWFTSGGDTLEEWGRVTLCPQ